MSAPEEKEADLFISVFGGKKDDVSDALQQNLGEDPHYYQTWVNVSIMRRLGFLFVGGVESAGGIFDILCVLAVLAAVLAVFLFWQLVVMLAVIAVLTIFSGGAAIKFLKGTFIEAHADKVPCDKLESFVVDQVVGGNFVQVRAPKGYETQYATQQSSSVTKMFRGGIYFALFIATLFMILEVIYYILNQMWMTNIDVLLLFAAGFLVGIAVMDLGVLLRRQLAKKVNY